MIDPSWYGDDGWEINQYPKREKGKWVEFEKGVTAENIKNYNKIKKVYWKNSRI